MFSGGASATTRYVAPTAGTFSGSGVCNGQTAITPATLTSTMNSAGDTVWFCNATFTGSGGATVAKILGSGTSSSPITVNLDNGAIIQAPYCNASNGCLDIDGLSWIVVNVPSGTGTIQNTANGDGLANQQISIGIDANNCTHCTIENVTIANMYIAIQNYSSPLGGSATQINAIYMTGQNNTITGNTIHDCGWCIYIPYGSGDTNLKVTNNNVYHWDHGMMFATSSAIACTAPCLFLENNQFHDNINWETAGCVYHLDGLHTFGVSGSTMNGIYIDNNYFYGSLSGPCSSGFLFMEQGSPSQSNASNVAVWNNDFDAHLADGYNPNGWVGLFSGTGGTLQVYNNTLQCPSLTDAGTVGWGVQQQSANTIFENNVEINCPQGNAIEKGSGSLTADYNSYGGPCGNGNNCWVWNAAVFEGTFSAWKAACSCDAHSQSLYTGNVTTSGSAVTWSSGATFIAAMAGQIISINAVPYTASAVNSSTSITLGSSAGTQSSPVAYSNASLLLNSNGSPQASSPIIQQGVNLTSVATGNLASLALDTTLGGTRVATTRPTGTCSAQGTSSCWDEGAFQFASGSTVATPTFSPVAGTYGSTQSVTISTSTGGAALCYTTDGTTPTANGAGTCTHGTTYTTAVSVSSSITLKAVGSEGGFSDSPVGSATYVIAPNVVQPTFAPGAGTYTSTQSVVISSSTSGATFCYTTDGTTPTGNGAGTCTHGTTYSGAISVSVSETIKAIGTKSGNMDSSVGSAAYTINLPSSASTTASFGVKISGGAVIK